MVFSGDFRGKWPLGLLVLISVVLIFVTPKPAKPGLYNARLFIVIGENILSEGIGETGFLNPLYTASDTHTDLLLNEKKVVPDGKIRFYTNHPPLLGNLVALDLWVSQRLGYARNFEEKQKATGIIPRLSTLGSAILIYLIALLLFNQRVAFLSSTFTLMTPMFRSYGVMLCHEAITTFFILATFYLYLLWVRSGRRGLLYALIFVICVGCYTGWPEYYALPLLSIHCLLFIPSKKKALIFPALGLLMFSLYLLHVFLVAGGIGISDLFCGAGIRNGGTETGFLTATQRNLGTVKRMSTAAVFFGSLFLVFPVISKLRNRESVYSEVTVVLLTLVGFAHLVVWPAGALQHEYWGYYMIPGLVLAAVSSVDAIGKSIVSRVWPERSEVVLNSKQT